MSDLPTVVKAISDATAVAIENIQLRPLNDGRILFGRRYVDETRAPNSIVMVPTRGTFGPPQATAAPNGINNQTRLQSRPLWSETTEFEVHVWGAATPSNHDDDIRVTQLLYQCLMIACFGIAATQVKPGSFQWASQQPDSATRDGLGQYFIFQLSVSSSVIGAPVNFVPAGTRLVPTLNLSSPTPST